MPDDNGQDHLTPVQVEAKLRQLVNDLGRARIALRQARDIELDKKTAWERARRRLLLSADCPKMSGPGAVSAAERDAWVDDQIDDLALAHQVAKVARESAQEHMRTLKEQAELVRSLGASVRQAYDLAGRAD
jgi:hypothetical protein